MCDRIGLRTLFFSGTGLRYFAVAWAYVNRTSTLLGYYDKNELCVSYIGYGKSSQKSPRECVTDSRKRKQ